MPRKNVGTVGHFRSQNFPYYNTLQPKHIIYKKQRRRCDIFKAHKKKLSKFLAGYKTPENNTNLSFRLTGFQNVKSPTVDN